MIEVYRQVGDKEEWVRAQLASQARLNEQVFLSGVYASAAALGLTGLALGAGIGFVFQSFFW